MSEHENVIPAYMRVFYALSFFTILTVVAAKWIHFPPAWGTPGDMLHVSIGVIIAVIKVICVMYIFMHLKFDNPVLRLAVYIPVFLFCVLVFALNFLETFDYKY